MISYSSNILAYNNSNILAYSKPIISYNSNVLAYNKPIISYSSNILAYNDSSISALRATSRSSGGSAAGTAYYYNCL